MKDFFFRVDEGASSFFFAGNAMVDAGFRGRKCCSVDEDAKACACGKPAPGTPSWHQIPVLPFPFLATHPCIITVQHF